MVLVVMVMMLGNWRCKESSLEESTNQQPKDSGYEEMEEFEADLSLLCCGIRRQRFTF